MPIQNQVAEPWGEAFDLCLDAFGHVLVAPRGYMTISPTGLLTFGGSRLVKQALLCQKHKGSLCNLAFPDG